MTNVLPFSYLPFDKNNKFLLIEKKLIDHNNVIISTEHSKFMILYWTNRKSYYLFNWPESICEINQFE